MPMYLAQLKVHSNGPALVVTLHGSSVEILTKILCVLSNINLRQTGSLVLGTTLFRHLTLHSCLLTTAD